MSSIFERDKSVFKHLVSTNGIQLQGVAYAVLSLRNFESQQSPRSCHLGAKMLRLVRTDAMGKQSLEICLPTNANFGPRLNT